MPFHTDNSAVGSSKTELNVKNKFYSSKDVTGYRFFGQDQGWHYILHEKGSARDSELYDIVSLPVPSSLPCEREWLPPHTDLIFLKEHITRDNVISVPLI